MFPWVFRAQIWLTNFFKLEWRLRWKHRKIPRFQVSKLLSTRRKKFVQVGYQFPNLSLLQQKFDEVLFPQTFPMLTICEWQITLPADTIRWSLILNCCLIRTPNFATNTVYVLPYLYLRYWHDKVRWTDILLFNWNFVIILGHYSIPSLLVRKNSQMNFCSVYCLFKENLFYFSPVYYMLIL